MTETKHIQTSLDMVTYDHLRHLSELKNKSLKETIQEAIKEYIKRHEGELMKDSFFGIVGSFRTKEGNWSERNDWRE
ncbi:hypothetical protein ANME2D_00031 [Candidatus Methanoperedens nitroreducens]|uniref:Uncharacterized protein n=1 Tax=Candidatus Methanoperedens nitratireducens TaxID=1392998 RepID=A0A062V8Y1_9EURY|nr:hypothetical protein [Candidatus Methanoperedens nitroreducens]KCZ72973.1 hypothetical protein ANME2D_00031 [Candidatus Methanoperedens nitroreducens]MDJ1423085.1 hypothetical protein [Candidatus Methanoperedens sp.]